MTDHSGSINRMIVGLRQGDSRVAEEFWSKYGDALQRVADRRLPRGLRARIAPEDVVQSVCRTFLRRAGEGQFELESSKGLWGLLCAITLTKVHEQSRYHLRKKRGADREVAGALSPGDTFAGPTPVDDEPTPAEAAEFADQFDHLFESLNDEERRIVELKLDGCTNDEVAAKLNCSERTVRRLMKQLQARLETQLDTIDQSVG